MVYAGYRRILTQKIPDNLPEMLTMRGPWNEYLPDVQALSVELLKAWKEKLGQKTWFWTHPGKYGGDMLGIPRTTPRFFSSSIKRPTLHFRDLHRIRGQCADVQLSPQSRLRGNSPEIPRSMWKNSSTNT